MSDMLNPFVPFDAFFKSTTKVKRRKKLLPLKKLLSKKIAKRLFGKAFAQGSRAELQSAPELARPIIKAKRPALQVSWAKDAGEIQEAQRLRFKVFAEEMGTSLSPNAEGLDVDEFDAYCDHLIIRDQETLRVVGTYRVLPPHKAQEIGKLYSDSEFDLSRLNHLRAKMVEVGRSCVHQD
jgi:putative hemolysin